MMETAENSASFNEELAKLMGRGKRHYICNEVVQAVQCFEEANQMLNKKYGQLADECGEAYLYYGKSLIDLARKETGILGGALKVGEDQNDDGDSEDDEAAEDEEMETEETPDKDEETAEKTEEPGADGSAEKQAETEEITEKTECNTTHADNNEENKAADTEDATEKTESNTTHAGDSEQNNAADTAETIQKTESNTTHAGDDKENNAADTESNTTRGDDDKENKTDTAETIQKTESSTTRGDDDKENKADTAETIQKTESSTTRGDDNKENKADTAETIQKTESSTTPAGDDGEVKETEAPGDTADPVGDGEQPADTASGDMKITEDGGPTQPGSGGQAEQNNDAGGNEEDITTMELAWEILELSRLIHERQETREARLNLAQTYLKLGEIQMERELFLEAIDEFQKCYQIQQDYLDADDRLLAETLYNIGLAYSIYSPPQHKESKENYTKALDVIELRMKNIEARLQEFDSKGKGKQKASNDDPCVIDRKELSELQDLYPEIKAKIDDAQEMMANALSSKAELIQSIAVKKPNGDTAKPATDISHLVKRKRKPEGPETTENPDTDGPAKKPRQENGTENTNGH